MEIFISRNGEKHGPYTLEQIQGFLASGQMQGSDKAWYEGVKGWVSLSQVPGVQLPKAGSVPPPPAPVTHVVVNAPKKRSPVLVGCGGCLGLIIGLSALGALFGPKSGQSPAPSSSSGSPASSGESVPTPAAIKVSAVDLHAAFEANSIAAEAKYEEKPVAVTGTVASIAEDIAGDATIMLETGNRFIKVRCVFYENVKPQIAKLQVGDLVTVSGICGGGTALGAVIKNCMGVAKA